MKANAAALAIMAISMLSLIGYLYGAVTGWGQSEDRRRSRQAGFDAHLVKPVDYDALASILISA